MWSLLDFEPISWFPDFRFRAVPGALSVEWPQSPFPAAHEATTGAVCGARSLTTCLSEASLCLWTSFGCFQNSDAYFQEAPAVRCEGICLGLCPVGLAMPAAQLLEGPWGSAAWVRLGLPLGLPCGWGARPLGPQFWQLVELTWGGILVIAEVRGLGRLIRHAGIKLHAIL